MKLRFPERMSGVLYPELQHMRRLWSGKEDAENSCVCDISAYLGIIKKLVGVWN